VIDDAFKLKRMMKLAFAQYRYLVLKARDIKREALCRTHVDALVARRRVQTNKTRTSFAEEPSSVIATQRRRIRLVRGKS
jgi:hypothetical protein